jgi:hypothetical protein
MEGILRGLAVVVLGLCGWHVSFRSPQADRVNPPVVSVSAPKPASLFQPLPAQLYRAAVTTRAVLPPPPTGCLWRIAVVGPGCCADRSHVTIAPSNGSSTTGAETFIAHRISPTHRVSRPVGRQDAPGLQASGDSSVHDASPHRDGPEVDLHVHETAPNDPRGYVAVKTYVAAQTPLVRVLVDRQLSTSDLAPGLVEAVVAAWTNEVQPTLTRQFESPVLAGRVDLVLSPLLSRFRGTVPLDGMVRPDDLRTDLARPFSAGREVVYLNSRLRPGDTMRTVLAHEATHLACLQVRRATMMELFRATPGATSESTSATTTQAPWLNEGLAHWGERLVAPGWSNLQSRLIAWSENTRVAPVWLDPEISPDRWRDPASRAAAYLFTEWLGRRYGPGFCEAVCRSPSDGIDSLEPLLGVTPADLLQEFAMACLLADRPDLVRQLGGVPLVDLPAMMRPRRQPATGVANFALDGSALLLLEPTGEAGGWQIELTLPGHEPAAILAIAVPDPVSVPGNLRTGPQATTSP